MFIWNHESNYLFVVGKVSGANDYFVANSTSMGKMKGPLIFFCSTVSGNSVKKMAHLSGCCVNRIGEWKIFLFVGPE